jgi:hypothetical protein
MEWGGGTFYHCWAFPPHFFRPGVVGIAFAAVVSANPPAIAIAVVAAAVVFVVVVFTFLVDVGAGDSSDREMVFFLTFLEFYSFVEFQ